MGLMSGSDNWTSQVDEYLRIACTISESSLVLKYKKSILDRTLRGASDIISCENLNICNNTMSMIQWCLQWSEEAIQTYKSVAESLTIERLGRPPTHRQICNARDSNNKRYWTVEHQYPMLIPKNGLINNGWSYSTLRDWMYQYGKATIITTSEEKKLLRSTGDMEVASTRYLHAGITTTTHFVYSGEGGFNANTRTIQCNDTEE